jgi:uncharacterized protein
MSRFSAKRPCRILCLDGGGVKGFYTIGVLKGIEGMLGRPVHEGFDLVFGTSTGSIIAALICLGRSIEDIHGLYREHVVKVMGKWLPWSKSSSLRELADTVFLSRKFEDFRTPIGIVATRWVSETPFIFKSTVAQAHGDTGNFRPGFDCTISDAVQASCSAYPFFCRKKIDTHDEKDVLAADGGFCANNPTLYAIAEATEALRAPREHIRVVSIGVGQYLSPRRYLSLAHWAGYLFTVRLLQKVLEINTKSMDRLRHILFHEVPTIRINNTYREPEMATDLFEADLRKLDLLYQRGRESFREHEGKLRDFMLGDRRGDS